MKRMQITYGYDDVTLVPAYSDLTSRSQANPKMHEYKLPIIASCMDTLGKEMMECVTTNEIPMILHRSFKSSKDQFEYFIGDHIDEPFERYNRIWFAVGSVQKYKEWIDDLLSRGVRKFCVDMAHGDSKSCIDTIKYLREKLDGEFKNKTSSLSQTPHIIAGNVATPEGFKRLQQAGANGIRIGVASGSICSTCLETGMGVPILTNIMECVKVRKHGTWIIADGGIKTTGDIAKAVYFGADFCMIGKLFASTNKASGKCFNKDKKEIIFKAWDDKNYFDLVFPEEFDEKYKLAEKMDWENKDNQGSNKSKCINNLVAYREYHGMASRDARKGVLSYASVEGVSGLVQYSGTTENFINDTFLRLQASLSYAGAHNWEEFRKNTYPVLRSNAGIIAADTHLDITMNK